MNQVFSNIPGTLIIVYQDDLGLSAENVEQLLTNLRFVFIKCRELHLKINFAKSTFVAKEIKFLGRIISAEGIRIDESRISDLKNMPFPKIAEILVRSA